MTAAHLDSAVFRVQSGAAAKVAGPFRVPSAKRPRHTEWACYFQARLQSDTGCAC